MTEDVRTTDPPSPQPSVAWKHSLTHTLDVRKTDPRPPQHSATWGHQSLSRGHAVAPRSHDPRTLFAEARISYQDTVVRLVNRNEEFLGEESPRWWMPRIFMDDKAEAAFNSSYTAKRLNCVIAMTFIASICDLFWGAWSLSLYGLDHETARDHGWTAPPIVYFSFGIGLWFPLCLWTFCKRKRLSHDAVHRVATLAFFICFGRFALWAIYAFHSDTDVLVSNYMVAGAAVGFFTMISSNLGLHIWLQFTMPFAVASTFVGAETNDSYTVPYVGILSWFVMGSVYVSRKHHIAAFIEKIAMCRMSLDISRYKDILASQGDQADGAGMVSTGTGTGAGNAGNTTTGTGTGAGNAGNTTGNTTDAVAAGIDEAVAAPDTNTIDLCDEETAQGIPELPDLEVLDNEVHKRKRPNDDIHIKTETRGMEEPAVKMPKPNGEPAVEIPNPRDTKLNDADLLLWLAANRHMLTLCTTLGSSNVPILLEASHDALCLLDFDGFVTRASNNTYMEMVLKLGCGSQQDGEAAFANFMQQERLPLGGFNKNMPLVCVDGQIISCHINAIHTRCSKQAVIAVRQHIPSMNTPAACANEGASAQVNGNSALGVYGQPRVSGLPTTESSSAARQQAAHSSSVHTVANPSLLFGELTDVRPNISLKWKAFEPETQRFSFQDH